jgi:endoglucanase
MRSPLFPAWLAALIAALPPLAPAAEPAAPQQSRFEIRRGVNISHWLSQSDRRGPERRARFTRADAESLARLGFDHLRLPIDEEQMWDTAGKPDPEAFALLDEALDHCADLGLKAVVDLHILRSHHFDAKIRPLWTEESARQRFVDAWVNLSQHLAKRPTQSVAYELLNEPVAPDPDAWNDLLARAHAAIRQREPLRFIVIGSNHYQSTSTFDRLRVPSDDPRLILAFHFYEPFHLTHHQASWTAIGGYRGPVRYPGPTVAPEDLAGLPPELERAMRGGTTSWDRARIAEALRKPLALAAQTGLPLYCGEWGCRHTVPAESRLAWYADVASVLAEHRIAWSLWDFRGTFGMWHDGQLDQPVIDRVMNPAGSP